MLLFAVLQSYLLSHASLKAQVADLHGNGYVRVSASIAPQTDVSVVTLPGSGCPAKMNLQ